jgi:hypothetical protein
MSRERRKLTGERIPLFNIEAVSGVRTRHSFCSFIDSNRKDERRSQAAISSRARNLTA